MILKAVNNHTGEIVQVVGFLGQDTGRGFSCVCITAGGLFKAIENWKLSYMGEENEGKLESDTAEPSGAV